MQTFRFIAVTHWFFCLTLWAMLFHTGSEAWCWTKFQQEELPKTPACIRLTKTIECVNNPNAEERIKFLKNAFADQDEFDNRCDISASLHDRFSPLVLHKLISSDSSSVEAIYKSRNGLQLRWELDVSEDSKHLITRISMEPVSDESPSKLKNGMLRLLRKDGTTELAARGIWKAEGYGYLFEVRERDFRVFNVTKSFGWEQEFDEEILFYPPTEPGKIVFTFHPLEPGYNMVALEKLPDVCQREFRSTPTNQFGAFVEIFEAHYPFFETREFDWNDRLKQVRATVHDSMSAAELFDAMSSMIDGLDDGHVSLSAQIDGKDRNARTGGEDTRSRLRESFEPTDEFKTYSRYFRHWRKRMRASLLEDVLGSEGNVVANEQIIWGRADQDIGYMFIGGMGGYSFGNIDSQVSELHRQLDLALTELADTKAMIVDISFNGGGSDLFSLEIASRFADQPRVGFSKWPKDHMEYRNDRKFTPYNIANPGAAMYTKPVYLVTNDVTASAAEIFTMCMRALPNVTTVGLPTEGALSDVLGKTLPNGWELGLSNEIYVDHEGVCHEGPGVPPEIRMDIFDPNDIKRIGHSASILKIVKLIKERLDE